MAIKSFGEDGFITVTRRGDKIVDETAWNYDEDFGLRSMTVEEMRRHLKDLPKDESIVYVTDAKHLRFLQWQCQRATSENLTNAATSTGKAPHAEALTIVAAKRDSLKRAEIAVGGGASMDPFERELRTFAERFLIARGVASSMAIPLSRKIDEAVEYVAKIINKNDTPEEKDRILKLWSDAAERRLQDYADLGESA